ncbi:MAG: SOS response-associated peptidase [Firmicutes bacterium]|nr:SOS response-associated peptidase [Bacillota bacterium]
MCGRFTLFTPLSQILPRFGIEDVPFDYVPSYNIAPTQTVFTIIPTDGGAKGALMRWGLIPAWRRDMKSAPTIINARAETLGEKVSFKGLVNHRRCLIIADGFYEWKQVQSAKVPIYITISARGPFAFAGLWDLWRGRKNQLVSSCTIITGKATSYFSSLHQRMPIILTEEEEKIWLSPKSFQEIKQVLIPKKTDNFTFTQVSSFVNSPANNSPQCIHPAG